MSEDETRPAAEILREIVAERRKRDEDNRRLGIVQISGEDLQRLFGFPDDVELVSVWADWEARSIRVMVRSPRFVPVPSGCHAPTVASQFTLISSKVGGPQADLQVALDLRDEDGELVQGPLKTYVRFEWVESE